MTRSTMTRLVGTTAAAGVVGLAALAATLGEGPARAQVPARAQSDLAASCTAEAMNAVVGASVPGVTVRQIPNGPQLPGGVKLVPASGKIPAYCQVTGSFVTNPKTGKTANFLATFPERWNGKYLQLGCSGICGYLLMNDPASPPITVTAQGYPGQLIEKGYATFGNDLGHIAAGPQGGSFAFLKNTDGSLNVDGLEDYLYRSDMVMADMGKAFTRAFYSRQTGAPATIARSYYSGCSQGGRGALVAATRFPEKFDGIIAGSPLSDQPGVLWSQIGRGFQSQQLQPAKFTPAQVDFLKQRVITQCDALDGVKDGLIQNPAACNIDPGKDFPVCKPGAAEGTCISQAQADSLSTYFSGMTDEAGIVVQPGYSISDAGYGFVAPLPATFPLDGDMRFVIGKQFDGTPLTSTRAGGPGQVQSTHVVVNGAAYRKYLEIVRKGTILPEDFDKLIAGNGKLLWYHNLSDEALTPYMSINRYKALARLHGGYAKLQRNIRLFTLPGTGHCGMGGVGPGNFDAAGALEAWIERGVAPQALVARLNDPAKSNLIMGKVDWSQPAVRTMPLCTFPQMARYKGTGDINQAANWECRASDQRMLKVGTTGKAAGVLR